MVLFTIEKILSQEIDFEELQHKIKKIFSKILKQKKILTSVSNFLPSFLTDNNILVPLNQRICKLLKCQQKPISLFTSSYIKKHLNSKVFD